MEKDSEKQLELASELMVKKQTNELPPKQHKSVFLWELLIKLHLEAASIRI